MTTVLRSAVVLDYIAGNNPSSPGVCALADDTILLAWQNLDTGAITLTHYGRDLQQIEQTTISAALPSFPTSEWGMAMFPRGDGATLATSTQKWHVTTAPLTATSEGGHTAINWANAGASTATLADGRTARNAYDSVVIHDDGALTEYPVRDGWAILSIAPDGGDLIVAAEGGEFGASVTDLYRLNATTGAVQLIESSWATSFITGVLGLPGRYAAMTGDPALLRLHDTAGNVVTDPDWPSGPGDWTKDGYAGSMPHDSGLLAVVYSLEFASKAGALALAHMTGDALTVTPLTDPAGTVPMVLNWAQSPVIVDNGRTAVVARAGFHPGSPNAFGISLWSVEVGTDARLKVGVIQGGQQIWRKVGDESWADGPGRLKLGVPRSQSPSGYVMEVKPGDDTTGARMMYVDLHGDGEPDAVRMIPCP